jgi:hypothetical protein
MNPTLPIILTFLKFLFSRPVKNEGEKGKGSWDKYRTLLSQGATSSKI